MATKLRLFWRRTCPWRLRITLKRVGMAINQPQENTVGFLRFIEQHIAAYSVKK